MVLPQGTRLGPYEIVALLGRGGMGEVYRGTDSRLERTVALKVLQSEVADSVARRQRFEREAQTISSLTHPHICALYDIGEHEGTPFLVMEYLEGETLAHRLVRGALPIEDVLRYAVEIIDALEHAGRQGVVHRDLKPANIMLTRAGVKLLDFGLAKLQAPELPERSIAGSQPQPTITEEGTLLGTLQYMAPEQLEGREADTRTDIFALGAVVYEMLAGAPAFGGPSRASTIASILERNPVPVSAARPETPVLLEQLVNRCLEKNPDDRWQTASDLKQAMKWVADSGWQVHSEPMLQASRNRRARLVAAVLLSVAVATVVSMTLVRRARPDVRAIRFAVAPPENLAFSESSAFMALSPDGHSLAFSAALASGEQAIWIRSLESLAARQVPGTQGGGQPFWSPDSRYVAFRIPGEWIRRIEPTGGLPQPLVRERGAQNGTWNRDGVVVFMRDAPSGGSLYQVSTAGAQPTPATTLDAALGETAHVWPQFLPDGRHFLYLARSTRPDDDSVVYVGSLDSDQRVRLFNADSHAVYARPGYLLYMQESTLVARPFDAVTVRVTGEPVPIAGQVERTPGSRRGAFSVSDTGVLAYRTVRETELSWYDRTGKKTGVVGAPGLYANPALSPDEQRLAVARVDAGTGESNIWVIDLARGNLSRFTSGSDLANMPLWTPDGGHILFRANRGQAVGNRRFYPKAIVGAESVEMLPQGGDQPIAFSPDGRALIYGFSNHMTRFDLAMLPLAGGQPASISSHDWDELEGRLSPDGRWMGYVSNESGRYELFVRSFPGGAHKWQISSGGGVEPAWRGDGRELFYLAPDRTLMAVSLKESTGEPDAPHPLFPTRMSPLVNPGYTRNQYVVTADGQRFLINQTAEGASSSPITVMLNWTAVLHK